MNDSPISIALNTRFVAFKNDPSLQAELDSEVHLQGAAKLALDVAVLTNDLELKNYAQAVLGWLVDFEKQRYAEEDLRNQELFAEWDTSRKIIRESNDLIKSIIGMSIEDKRWQSLIEAYKESFPSFSVAASVYERMNPRSLSRALRKHLLELVSSRYPGRVPSAMEVKTLRAEAMLVVESATLRYLERALPGFDFVTRFSGLSNQPIEEQ